MSAAGDSAVDLCRIKSAESRASLQEMVSNLGLVHIDKIAPASVKYYIYKLEKKVVP